MKRFAQFGLSAGLATAGLILAMSPGYTKNIEIIPPSAKDPHYTDVGFFDIHICHWPDRPLFYMMLLSTTQFKLVNEVEVFKPNGALLGKLDMNRFSVKKKPDGIEKRVFITQLPVEAGAADGVYTARIHLTDGRVFGAEDYVHVERMALPNTELSPPDVADGIEIPKELRWGAVAGAQYYKVFIRDKWDEGKTIFESKLLTSPYVSLPEGLLKPGGWYAWRIHARDVNEDVKLGDFNHGSLTGDFEFTTRDGR